MGVDRVFVCNSNPKPTLYTFPSGCCGCGFRRKTHGELRWRQRQRKDVFDSNAIGGGNHKKWACKTILPTNKQIT